MTRRDEPIQPITLGNMRQNCVRGLDVTCLHCGHHTEVNVDRWPDDVPVPSFGPLCGAPIHVICSFSRLHLDVARCL